MYKNQQVDLPLLFFFVAFFVIILGLFSKLSFQKGSPMQSPPQAVAPPAVQKKVNLALKNLDFNKPILCSLNTKDSSISAEISETSAAVLIQQNKETKKVVVQGDCVYSWIEKGSVGKKQCGVGQYIAIGKQLLGSGLASAETIGQMVKQTGKNIPFDVGNLMESCRNVKSVEKGMFELPKNVVFK
jgi:hypothetical protein